MEIVDLPINNGDFQGYARLPKASLGDRRLRQNAPGKEATNVVPEKMMGNNYWRGSWEHVLKTFENGDL